MARPATRPSRAHHVLFTATIAGTALAAGCVEAYRGSNLQIDFSVGTPVPDGSDYDGAKPPDNTYFTFYAVDHVYMLDGDGNPVLDAAGNPIPEQTFLFNVTEFELKPLIDVSSPCFIELPADAEDIRSFPGLHVTMFEEKLKEVTNISDPFDPPSDVTEGDITDVLNAGRRMGLLVRLQNEVTSVASFTDFAYPAAQADCDATGEQIPAPTCTDDASNEQRLRACEAIWEANPNLYEGSDKVFTLPLNGRFFGMVEGPNPVNGGFVGGSTIFVDDVLSEADAFTIKWQFKDGDDDGEPDYPADFFDDPAHVESETGYDFVTGRPESRVRGVINTRMVSPYAAGVFAEVAIFSGLGDDDVNF